MAPRPETLALLLFFCGDIFAVFPVRTALRQRWKHGEPDVGLSFLAILAIGQAFPILVRGIDLSVGAIVALTGMVTFGLSLIFGLLGYIVNPLALLTATLAGAFNGARRLSAPPALHREAATLAAYRGRV